MCLSVSSIRSDTQWNWEGDVIVHSPVIPASRTIPGTRRRYETDIREYLSNRDNAVMKRTLDELVQYLPEDKRVLFSSHSTGSFDFRMLAITAFLSEKVRYRTGSRRFDQWLFPEETISLGHGDCEDRAFLLASLLLASGISSYVVRVALGKIYNRTTKRSQDHVWVMYKNEDGLWMLIEPILYTSSARRQTARLRAGAATPEPDQYEYIPYFVFNDSHLWALRNNTAETTFLDYLKTRGFWSEFNPEFAAGVHNHIFDTALPDLSWPELLYVKAVSTAIDINPAIYDPRDHFDNGYVPESWQLLSSRLRRKTLNGLALAGHAAGDFYAHTSYAHFAKRDPQGELLLFSGTVSDNLFDRAPDYGSADFDLRDEGFTTNPARCTMSRADSIAFWNSRKIISGRFAQPGDPHQGFFEKVFISIPYALRSREDFPPRACLPHHNEIAVDKPLDDGMIPSGHRLYRTPEDYAAQFSLRQDAAIRQIRQLYDEWVKKG